MKDHKPQDPDYLLGEQIVLEIKGSLEGSNGKANTLIKNEKSWTATQKKAASAQTALEQSLEKQSTDLAQAWCLRWLAYTHHFQQKDFNYIESLPAHYLKAIGHFDHTIKLMKQHGQESLAAHLCLEAAQVALPHIMTPEKTETVARALEHSHRFLRQAVALFHHLGDTVNELAAYRNMATTRTATELRYSIGLAKNVEGEQSLLMAKDIASWLKNHFAASSDDMQKEMSVVAKEAIKLFEGHINGKVKGADPNLKQELSACLDSIHQAMEQA